MPVVLITGCSSGFGFCTARTFAARGDTVYATVRSSPAAASPAHPSLHQVRLDVTDPGAVQRCVADILGREGRIDVLVNNAGVHFPGTVEDQPEAEIEAIMRTNFHGPVWLCRAVLPAMRAQGSGHIIMVSSLSALVGLPVESFYCASKAALEAFSEALRYEVDRFGISVSVIEPGLFRTGMPDKIAATFATREDSAYPELTGYLRDRAGSRQNAGDDPQKVADLILGIAASRKPAFRHPAGAQAEMVVGKLRGLDAGQREAFIRSVQGIEWWSEGKAPPRDA